MTSSHLKWYEYIHITYIYCALSHTRAAYSRVILYSLLGLSEYNISRPSGLLESTSLFAASRYTPSLVTRLTCVPYAELIITQPFSCICNFCSSGYVTFLVLGHYYIISLISYFYHCMANNLITEHVAILKNLGDDLLITITLYLHCFV